MAYYRVAHPPPFIILSLRRFSLLITASLITAPSVTRDNTRGYSNGSRPATMCDDESFTRAISGYRDAWLVQHSHLSESERNQLWSRRLSQFLPVSASPAGLHAGSPMRRSGKRFRQDIPRMLPPDSGFPSAKRQATVCDLGLLLPPLLLSAFPSCSS